MHREMCYRCFWPKAFCWCDSITPIDTCTKIVLLMHPKEFKDEKNNTGRFTHLCLKNSEIHMGCAFDDHKQVQALIHDPQYFPVLLYPSRSAINLSEKGVSGLFPDDKQLLVFLLDGTWRTARKMFNLSKSLQTLPHIMFTTKEKSRYVIKKQPEEHCLSTLEATHELLLALENTGLDHYDRPDQMINLFNRMQQFQIDCFKDPNRKRYRPYEGNWLLTEE
jgi:DTW domain-containing protein YfiP